MPNSTLKKKWMRWYPKKIFLKNEGNKKEFLYHSSQFSKKDFFVDLSHENQLNNIKNNRLDNIDLTTKEYRIGFEKGLSTSLKENIILEKKLNSFLIDCEKSCSIMQDVLYSRLLNTVLIVASYVIGEKTICDQALLVEKIKKVINRDSLFLKKPKILIHPNNKDFVKKTFKKFLDVYQWAVICDESLSLNSFKIQLEQGDIDATVDARWQELRHLINS